MLCKLTITIFSVLPSIIDGSYLKIVKNVPIPILRTFLRCSRFIYVGHCTCLS